MSVDEELLEKAKEALEGAKWMEAEIKRLRAEVAASDTAAYARGVEDAIRMHPLVTAQGKTGGQTMNNKYLITVEHPLIRPGLKIATEASEKYLVKVIQKVMELVRELNQPIRPTTEAKEDK